MRVTTPASFGRLYVSPLLPEFLAAHPQLRVCIDLSDRALDLVGTGFDLAIRIGVLDDSTLVARKLAANHRVLCAAPGYLRRHGEPRTPGDLERHECILLAGSRGPQDTWRLRDRDGRETAVRVRGRLESNFGEVTRDAAVAGLGIAVHSTWHVCEDLRAGRLQRVLPDHAVADSGIYAVMPQRRLVPPRVRAFTEFLAGKFGENPPWERALAK